MKKQILIVDSDIRQIRRIENVVRRAVSAGNSGIEIYTANGIEEATELLEEADIDMLILDTVYRGIKRGEYPGIDLVRKLRMTKKYMFLPVIFIASMEEPEIYAYRELQCLGFFPRIFQASQLLKVMDKASYYTTYRDWENYILPRKQGIIYPIKVKEILYVEMENRMLRIYRKADGMLEIPHKTLQKLQEESRSKCLVRCNRSTLVNRLYVKEVHLRDQYLILREDELKIQIGNRYREEVKKRFCMRDREDIILL